MKRLPLERLILGLVLLAGVALRLFRLGADSLWYDETVSVVLAGSPLPELIRHTAGDIHPPAYYVLLRGWLMLAGFPTGHADPDGMGLEFAAGFFSLFFGVLLLPLAYVLTRRLAGRRAALIAAVLIAFSPYHLWYSQEVRMYTLGASLGVVATYALWRGMAGGPIAALADHRSGPRRRPLAPLRFSPWWLVYALAAAAGMYTLYYFVFLLVPLNLWALWRTTNGGWRRANHEWRIANHEWRIANHEWRITNHEWRITAVGARLSAWSLANGLAVLLYAPWIPVAWRQATDPPVPPWRVTPNILSALAESWRALSLGQSAPGWLWPVLLLTAGLYASGLVALRGQWAGGSEQEAGDRGQLSALGYLPISTFGPLALILLASLFIPLYHVRYLFTYSPAFYAVLAAGLAWLPRRSWLGLGIGLGIWLAASAITAHAFWFDPAWRADDHRAAVRFLQERWRPGDVVLVNAGWTYTALATYWDGPIAGRQQLTAEPVEPRSDDALVMVTTGHLDGDPGLGWGDPRSDFFALPQEAARTQLSALFDRFDRVWHYRIYDTVNDPDGHIRSWLDEGGRLFEDQVFAGEANMRVQGFLPRRAAAFAPTWPTAHFERDLAVHVGPLPDQVAGGQALYPLLVWEPAAGTGDFAVSVRLVAMDGTTWAQGRDERPVGPLYPPGRWDPGRAVRYRAALPIPIGTPPDRYAVELVVYDPATGQPWEVLRGAPAATPGGVRLGEVAVVRPAEARAARRPLARFGPLALIEAHSPATTVTAGDRIPLELLWQATDAPAEPLVVVVQLLDRQDRPVASLEEEPTAGRYPTHRWATGELVRDRHVLTLPADLAPGTYRLIVGVYRAADRVRFTVRTGLLGARDYWAVKTIQCE